MSVVNSNAVADGPTFLEQALALAAQGFRVFPLAAGGKLPAIGGWPQRATNDQEAVQKLWSTYDPVNDVTYVRPFNIGIATGAFRDGFLTVLDVDVKSGAQGLASLETLDLLAPNEGWRDGVYRVNTPSGGLHLYFFTAQPLGTTASKIASGLDTRGVGGYVVAPGSVIGDRSYELVGGEIKPAPEWLATEIGAPHERASNASSVLSLLDTPPAIDRATLWVQANAEHATVGQRGSTAYRVACKIRDLAVSALACQEIMISEWNPTHCSPPMEIEDLAASIDHAYRYALNPIGSLDPANDFEPWDEAANPLPPGCDPAAPIAKPARAKLHYTMWRDIEPDLTSIALIDNWLEQGATSLTYGGSNIGKTFVVMSGFAYSIAAGTPWNGNAVSQGAVLYVAAEAGVSAKKRIKAMRIHHGREDLPLALVASPVDLLRPAGDCKAIIDLAKKLETETGMKVAMIVIDTLSRALAGGDENGPVDMGSFIANVDRIRAQTDAHLMLIHHTGKNEALGARGWSGLRAAVDTEIEISEGIIRGTKQRDIEAQRPVAFTLKSVPIGTRPDGQVVTSAVAIFGDVEDAFNDIEPSDLAAVQAKVDGSRWGENFQSTDWVGFAVAEVLGLDLNTNGAKTKVKALLKGWISDGSLRVDRAHDSRTGRDRPVVVVGVRP